jgi:hypothetical protein
MPLDPLFLKLQDILVLIAQNVLVERINKVTFFGGLILRIARPGVKISVNPLAPFFFMPVENRVDYADSS